MLLGGSGRASRPGVQRCELRGAFPQDPVHHVSGRAVWMIRRHLLLGANVAETSRRAGGRPVPRPSGVRLKPRVQANGFASASC
jgi:hypothetical protein